MKNLSLLLLVAWCIPSAVHGAEVSITSLVLFVKQNPGNYTLNADNTCTPYQIQMSRGERQRLIAAFRSLGEESRENDAFREAFENQLDQMPPIIADVPHASMPPIIGDTKPDMPPIIGQ